MHPSPHIANLQTPGQPQLVSLIAPCRNEAAHIHAFCDSVLAQQLPPGWQMEVLVADGQSDDATAQLLQARAAQDTRLHPVANPGRIVSTGLNACLAQARGQVIVRLDLHTTFAPDYVAQCLAALERSGAHNVGGPWVAQGQGPTGRAIAAAFQSRWVVGGARSRDTSYEGPVDTVYLGCWPRAVLAAAGGFDETLVRNQDDEHNLRLRRQGHRIWQSARIRSSYQPRASLRQLFAQQYQYGYWRPFVMRKHRQPGSPRQLAPMLFIATLALLALTSLWQPLAPVARPALAALLLAYTAYLLAASAHAAWSAQNTQAAKPGPLLLRLPAVIAAYHIGYGLGTWRGLLDITLGRRQSAQSAKLTR